MVDLCRLGDDVIAKECASVFKGKQIDKGVAFPTCVSANAAVGHVCPMPGDEAAVSDGDLLKM